MEQWGYGQSVTEESDGVLDLIDSCLEVRGDLVVAKQFFRDDAILQLKHQFCGTLVVEGNNTIDDVEGNLGLDEDMVWEDVTEVEEGVLTMEKDQGSHHLFLTHFQSCPYCLALVKAEDIMLGHTLCKLEKVLLKDKEGSWRVKGLAQARLAHFPSYQFQSSLIAVVRILQVQHKGNFVWLFNESNSDLKMCIISGQ